MKRFAALICAGVILLVCGCAPTTKWVKSPVVQEEYCTVELEHRVNKDVTIAQQYSHPCQLDAVLLETVLRGISYTEFKLWPPGRSEKTPVFKDEEVARLAPALSDALARATSDQRISFVSQNKSKGLFFWTQRQTQGVIFVKPEGSLNIAFNLINRDLDSNSENFSRMPANIPEKDPLEIERFEKSVISELPYAKPHALKNGGPSPVWLVVDLDELKKAPRIAPDVASEKERAVSPAQAQGFDEKPMQAPQAKTWEDQKKEMEEKLKFLKGLFDQGLINQKEYEAQKSGILKGFNMGQ